MDCGDLLQVACRVQKLIYQRATTVKWVAKNAFGP